MLGGTINGKTITKNFLIPVPSNASSANNISFVAFVIDATGKNINVRGAKSNINQSIQENL